MKKTTLLLKKLSFVLIFFYLYSCIFAQKQTSPFTYVQYLEQEQQKKKIQGALKNHQFTDALSFSEQLNCYSFSCREKYELMALSYFGMGDNKKGEKYLLMSIENGADIEILKYNEFPVAQEKILQAHKKYVETIDLKLRKQLFDDYYEKKSPAMLDSLITIGEYPGLQEIGHQTRCNKEIPEIKHYEVFLETADNEKVIEYYNLFATECEHYNESWKELEGFVKMNMEQQLIKNRVSPLDFIYLTSDNNLDVQKSLLQLVTITKIAKQARFYQLTLHCSNLISQEIWERLIPQFKKEFEIIGNDDVIINYKDMVSENSRVKSLFYLTTE